jgi:hypothetical protein
MAHTHTEPSRVDWSVDPSNASNGLHVQLDSFQCILRLPSRLGLRQLSAAPSPWGRRILGSRHRPVVAGNWNSGIAPYVIGEGTRDRWRHTYDDLPPCWRHSQILTDRHDRMIVLRYYPIHTTDHILKLLLASLIIESHRSYLIVWFVGYMNHKSIDYFALTRFV